MARWSSRQAIGDDDGGVRRRARWRLHGTIGNGAGGMVLGTTGTGAGGTLLTGVGQVKLVGSSLRASKLFVEAKRTVFWDRAWASFRADFSARRTLALFRLERGKIAENLSDREG